MAGHRLENVVQQLRGLVCPAAEGLSDAQLLARWLKGRDQGAFELIVWRHGPTVLGVCQRLLARSQDVEDAFQATFLVFLSKAHTIGKHASVGSWLYKVAYRVAQQARSRSARQTLLDGRDILVPAPDKPDSAGWREARAVIDEELNRLPERYRAVFIYCCLQGKTNAEAARELGVPTGTVQSRLSRARERLRSRLTRRGVTLTTSLAAGGFAADASAAVPAPLVVSTMKAVLLGAGEQAVAAGVISAQTAILTKGALHVMWLTKLQMTTAVVLVAVLVGGGSITVYQTLAAGPNDPQERVTTSQTSGTQRNDTDKAWLHLEANLAQALRRLEKSKQETMELRDQVRKLEADLKAAQEQRKALEAKLVELGSFTNTYTSSSVPAGPTVTQAIGAVVVSESALQDATDDVAILRAQLQVKGVELLGARVDYDTARKELGRVQSSVRAVPQQVADAAQAKVRKAEVAIRVKEAEVAEQQVRLTQGEHRLTRLRKLAGLSTPRNETGRSRELRDIRAQLERLQQRVGALEKDAGK